MEVTWVATLSNGTTATEHYGDFEIIDGQRKPWVRLCEFVADNGLHLTSLRLNVEGRTIHMPRERFEKFGIGEEENLRPNSYSLQYMAEFDDILGDGDQRFYVSVAAHYDDFYVHYIQDCEQGNGWIIVTRPQERLATTTSS